MAVSVAAWATACARRTRVHVFVFRIFHCVWVVLHSQPFHRCHHRQLQRSEEKGIFFILFPFFLPERSAVGRLLL